MRRERCSGGGVFEAELGNYTEAAKRLTEARPLADGENVLLIVGDLAGCYYLMGDCANAEPAAREALALATRFRHPDPKAVCSVVRCSCER